MRSLSNTDTYLPWAMLMVAAADGEAWSDWNFISEQELWQSVLGRVFCIPDTCCSARWVGLSWMVLTSLPRRVVLPDVCCLTA